MVSLLRALRSLAEAGLDGHPLPTSLKDACHPGYRGVVCLAIFSNISSIAAEVSELSPPAPSLTE